MEFWPCGHLALWQIHMFTLPWISFCRRSTHWPMSGREGRLNRNATFSPGAGGGEGAGFLGVDEGLELRAFGRTTLLVFLLGFKRAAPAIPEPGVWQLTLPRVDDPHVVPVDDLGDIGGQSHFHFVLFLREFEEPRSLGLRQDGGNAELVHVDHLADPVAFLHE